MRLKMYSIVKEFQNSQSISPLKRQILPICDIKNQRMRRIPGSSDEHVLRPSIQQEILLWPSYPSSWLLLSEVWCSCIYMRKHKECWKSLLTNKSHKTQNYINTKMLFGKQKSLKNRDYQYYFAKKSLKPENSWNQNCDRYTKLHPGKLTNIVWLSSEVQ